MRRFARLTGFGLILPLIVTAVGCRQPPTPAGPAEFRTTVAGADWELIELAGQPAPTGAGGRRATIRFEPDTSRVAGFAGCNRYFGTYTLDGPDDSFRAHRDDQDGLRGGNDAREPVGDRPRSNAEV